MKFTIHSFTQLSMVLLAVTIMSVSVLGNSAYSSHVAGGGSTLDIIATEGSNTISISGTTDRSDEVIVKVLAPNRNIVSIDQITPTGGSFATTIETSGALWSQDGDYTITVQQHAIDKQFSESKYNHLVRIGITSGTTSAASISIDNTVEHDEYYVDSQHIPTALELKKLILTADGIQGSTTINVSGTTDRSYEVIIKVTAPNGNIVAIDQITPTGGSFATTIEVGGPLWSQDGTYTVKARQGPTHMSSFAIVDTTNFKSADDDNSGWLAYQNSAEVEILDGHVVPEFGVIAAMILAVAIVSIIVVTAKTKLSLVPRY